jgi:hypothetical protein
MVKLKESFKKEYRDILFKDYKSLTNREKQVLYAMELYKDSRDAIIANETWADTDIPFNYIDDQNRYTFDYTDNTIIN